MKLAFDLILHTLFHRVSPSCLIARGGISVTRPDGIALLRPGLPSPARHSNSPISACLASPVCPASRYAISRRVCPGYYGHRCETASSARLLQTTPGHQRVWDRCAGCATPDAGPHCVRVAGFYDLDVEEQHGLWDRHVMSA